MVKSQTFPSDSTTAPRCPLATSAAARVGYVSKCQKIGGGGRLPNGRPEANHHALNPAHSRNGFQNCPNNWFSAERLPPNHEPTGQMPPITPFFVIKGLKEV